MAHVQPRGQTVVVGAARPAASIDVAVQPDRGLHAVFVRGTVFGRERRVPAAPAVRNFGRIGLIAGA